MARTYRRNSRGQFAGGGGGSGGASALGGGRFVVTKGGANGAKGSIRAPQKLGGKGGSAKPVKDIVDSGYTSGGKFRVTVGTKGFKTTAKTSERLSGDKAKDAKTLESRVSKIEAVNRKVSDRQRGIEFQAASKGRAYSSHYARPTKGEQKTLDKGDAARKRLVKLEGRKTVGGKTIAQQAATPAGRKLYTDQAKASAAKGLGSSINGKSASKMTSQDKVRAAEVMFGTGSKQHAAAKAKFSTPGTALNGQSKASTTAKRQSPAAGVSKSPELLALKAKYGAKSDEYRTAYKGAQAAAWKKMRADARAAKKS